MEAKLIKVLEHYHLYDGDKAIATTIVGNPMLLPNISLKNCQAIENGYDLDKLAKEKYPYEKTEIFSCFELDCKQEGFIDGVKTILEILGDKKFSEDDVLKVVTHILNELVLVDGFDKQYLFPESIYQETTTKCKSLQQTEWDVEIEMICPHPMDTYRCGLQYGCDGDGCNHPEQVPYLDANGCLILKRKI